MFAALVAGLPAGSNSKGQETGGQERELPPALAPFEFLIGRWKGQGVPRDNPAQRFRGWTETHTWAWVFAGGRPVALTVSIPGGRVLGEGMLQYETSNQHYYLDTKQPGETAQAARFAGTLDSSGKLLTLERIEKGTMQRLTLRANSNYIRYTVILEAKEATAALFRPLIEIGLTKEGESFAAGAAAVELPRCIVTGGAATLTVSYQGQSYPICCTGCRDEFNENPEKYLSKLSRKTAAGDGAKTNQPKTSRVSRFEDAFAADTDPVRSQPKPRTAGRSAVVAGPVAPSSEETAEPSTKSGSESDTKVKEPDQLAARAARAFQLARNLERSGKSAAALKAYKQIVQDYARTATARVAAERIKALENQ
jgi:YHS domain-containing protein